MKTHAVKENRILKSFDFVLIVLTMSFVSFMILKSTVPFQDFTRHSGAAPSLKTEFPVSVEKGFPAAKENTVREKTMINDDPAGNAVNKEESVTAENKSVSVKEITVTATKEGVDSKAASVDQSSKITEKSKINETAPVADVQFDKSVLEKWINSRDKWEQK